MAVFDTKINSANELLRIRSRKQSSDRQKRRLIGEKRSLPCQLVIEPTNHCNLHCVKCPTHQSGRKRGYLELDLFRHIMKQVAAVEERIEVALSGAGEPTLHPLIVDLVKEARLVNNVGVLGFATNAVALNPSLAHELLKAGLNRLKISLDTIDPNEFVKLTGRSVYDEVVYNIESFCKLNRQLGHPCRVTLKATILDIEGTAVNALREKWAPWVDVVRITPIHNWGGIHGKERMMSRIEPCPVIWDQIQILWDGQITLCCMDSMEGSFNMGNAKTTDLIGYWKSNEELKKIRKLHLQGNFTSLPICASCDFDLYHDINP